MSDDLLNPVHALLWVGVLAFAGYVVAGIAREWWQEHQHARRMARPAFTRAANIAPSTPIETPAELKIRTAIYAEPVSAEKRQILDADRDIVLAFGVTADQAIASLDRALAAMTCATEGHVWVDELRLCSPALTICGRCGFDPATDMPLLWEGDQS